MRVAQGDIDVNTVPDLDTTNAVATTNQNPATMRPRIKLTSRSIAIDHPDPEQGERLMSDAFGVADPDAMYGMLRQLVRASVIGDHPDPVNLSFMMSMVESIKPGDSVEAMLVTQMVSVHVMAMRCAHQLAGEQDVARQESAVRALSRLARTFPAQIEALNRYRDKREPAVTVQNVSVGDGGRAIVGNVTQHASLIVSDKGTAEADA
jgi:hypothetical protein